jgi:hypothetical protein
LNWETAEILGYSYFSNLGYRICVPIVRNDGYDFVVEKDGEFLRVNVKVAGLKDKSNPNSWAISQASGGSKGRSEKKKCDVFLVYLPHLSRFIEVEGSFLDTGNSKSKRLPKELFLS